MSPLDLQRSVYDATGDEPSVYGMYPDGDEPSVYQTFLEVRRQLGYEFEDEVPLPEPTDEELPLAGEFADEKWTAAPGNSHVHSFRFRDDPDLWPEIDVRFKPSRTQPMRQYVYSFTDSERDLARIIWDELTAANHPGIVIWHWLIRGGVQYQEVGVTN